jgi:hypothetical protein
VIKSALQAINQMQSVGVIGRYAIGGAVGATFYLEPSATVDLDIFVEVQQSPESSLVTLAPIYEHLKKEGYDVSGEYIVIADWPVQFLVPASRLELEAVAEAVLTEVEGISTRVMAAEHLVAMALNTGRTKDHNRILQFLELKRVSMEKLMAILDKYSLISKWNLFERRYLYGE